MLRHDGVELDAPTRGRYHRAFEKLVLNLSLPSLTEERQNPARADELYQTGINWLLEATRNRSVYNLIFAENVSFGFRRNLLGLRPLGLLLAAGTLTVALLPSGSIPGIASSPIAAVAATCFGLFWIFVVNDVWVHEAADAYARRLLAALDTL